MKSSIKVKKTSNKRKSRKTRVSSKRVSSKRVSSKRVSSKRVSSKRVSSKRVSSKRKVRVSSKRKVRISSKKGNLYGYHVNMLARDRRALLVKLIKKRIATYSQIIKRLNVLAIYNKNKNPLISEKVRRDIKYIQSHIS